MDLQELVSRGRFIFSGAPKRLETFKFVDGKRSSKEISLKTGRSLESVLNDIKKMRDMGLIEPKITEEGKQVNKHGCIVYQKIAPLCHVPFSYFQDFTKGHREIVGREKELAKKHRSYQMRILSIPDVIGLLDICRHGEDQIYEFKSPGVETAKIAKEIAAFLHTRHGGLIFYGVDDDGSIIGSDTRRQDFDQALQNSIRYTISPRPTIRIGELDVLGHRVLIVVVPPWDRKNLYQYTKEQRVYVRKGTNVFVATSEELKKLGTGEYID